MKNFILVVLIALLVRQTAVCQWTQTGGPFGGGGALVAATDNSVFLAVSGEGLFKSANDGNSWSKVGALMSNTIWGLTTQGGNVVVQTQGGVFASTDEGTVWTRLPSPYSNATMVSFAGDYLFANGSSGLGCSTDNGSTWVKADTGITPGIWMYDVKAFKKKYIAATETGIYLSSNGTSWTFVDTTASFGAVRYITDAVTEYYSGLPPTLHTTHNLYISADSAVYESVGTGGLVWTKVADGFPAGTHPKGPMFVQGGMLTPATVYLCGGPSGTYVISTDDSVWTHYTGMGTNNVAYGMVRHDSIVIAGTYPSGAMRSTDSGTTWAACSQGIRGALVWDIAATPSTLMTIDCITRLDRSTDAGASWTSLTPPHGMGNQMNSIVACEDTVVLSPSSSQITAVFYVGTQSNGVWKSTDNGETWGDASGGSRIRNAYEVHAWGSSSAEKLVCVASYAGVGISHDGGTSWNVFKPSPTDSVMTTVAMDGERIVAGSITGHVYRSTDGGTSWEDWTGNHGSVPGNSLAFQDSIVLYADQNTVWRRGWNSSQWLSTAQGISNPVVVSFTCVGQGTIGSSWYCGPFFLPAGDTAWQPMGSWTDTKGVHRAAVIGSTVYLGSMERSVWVGSFPAIVTGIAAPQAATLPDRLALQQNWPNPCNPSTTIAYQVGAGSRQYAEGSRQKDGAGVQVRLAVYDLLGREVAVLVDGYQTPGEHRVVFNGSTFASGVYFYRLNAEGQTLTKRLVLLK